MENAPGRVVHGFEVVGADRNNSQNPVERGNGDLPIRLLAPRPFSMEFLPPVRAASVTISCNCLIA
jgi:hypothetical protein